MPARASSDILGERRLPLVADIVAKVILHRPTQIFRAVAWGKGSFQRRTVMNTRKVPAMATTPESFVDALNSAFGKQTTQRAAHAKGVVLLGKFVPSAEAASVSKALHFRHEVPVTVRFSANSGIPKIADADPRAAPRGLAIKF